MRERNRRERNQRSALGLRIRRRHNPPAEGGITCEPRRSERSQY